MTDREKRAPATIAAHTVRAPNPETLPDGERATPSAEPLYQTSVFDFESIEDSDGPLAGAGGYVYARYGLPNARSLELTLAALEGADDALATSSGMSAVACCVLAAAKTGERVLVQRDAYGGTLTLLARDFARLGVTFEALDAYDVDAVRAALSRPAKLVIVETLSNPLIREVDVAKLADLCRERGALLAVDNTFATPVLRRPIGEGADLVIHSATKFLGGHHDLCAGVLAGGAAFVAEARGVAKRFGMTAAPLDAWLACRGVRTLDVRMQRAQATTSALASWLRADRRVRAVHHPGWGAMLSFDVGDLAAASRVVRALTLVTLTPSLGGTATTVSHSATSSHRGMTPAERAALGIGDGLLRLSVGLEDVDDLKRDLDAALASAP
jgi:cystathionine beta-lyase/cystathionine gamma-synthase